MQTWYHGSPIELQVLRVGSTITPLRRLAEAFSHKPELLVAADDGTIRHTGRLPGFLYVVEEALAPRDIVPHPSSTMAPGSEYFTTRDLRLKLVGVVPVTAAELLSEPEVVALRQRCPMPRPTGDIR